MTSKTPTSIEAAKAATGDKALLHRPLRRVPPLPDPASIKMLRAEAKKHLGMSDQAVGSMSSIWAKPDQILPQIAHPRTMRIPGGDLLYIEGLAWTSRIIADPENPRNAANYHYPISGADADAGDLAVAGETRSERAEQVVTVESRIALLHELDVAGRKTLSANPLHPPIGEQGIMDAPIGVMTVFEFKDGSPAVAVPRTREGTSRIVEAHRDLGISPHDTVLRYPSSSTPMKQLIAEINALFDKPEKELSKQERAKIRCATTPFILIVGFVGDGTDVDLEEAIKVKVAQEHLNRKRDWPQSSQSAVIADDCIQAARQGGLLSGTAECQWLLGRLSADQAAKQHLGRHPDDRFTRLIYLFTSEDPQVHQLIRGPIAFVLERDLGRTRANVRKTMKLRLAVELAARELRGAHFPGAIERITKVMMSGGLLNTDGVAWEPTDRPIEELVKAAYGENSTPGAGPAGAELAIRALYYIAHYDLIHAPRHDLGEGGDRRPVGDVLEDMLRSAGGIDRLGKIVSEGRQGRKPELRDDQPSSTSEDDGESAPEPPTLRNMFPKIPVTNVDRDDLIAGSTEVETTPRTDVGSSQPDAISFTTAQRAVDRAITEMEQAIDYLAEIRDVGSDNSLVAEQGVDPVLARKWLGALSHTFVQVQDWFQQGVEYWTAASERPASLAVEESMADVQI